MAKNPNHHISIHGHFYQPPRENPWLGVIENQESAKPFPDWNSRINAECYQQLTSSAVTDANHEVADLFNCYAHLSFNFGPTLLAWLEKNDPETLARLRIADELALQSYQGSGAALAQGYNHMILPLADSAERHTQIVWGLREFKARFGRAAESIWLPETAINMATVRALIDHGIKFVILSPYQASYTRQFGADGWTGVPDGTIDTRLPYRLFEVDGAGRTHFHRYLDVFFYDKTLSTKVSFEHLLTNADRLEEEICKRFAPDATLPQIVLIATDGEIYGHHEKFGNRALAYFLARTLQQHNLSLSNLGQYLRENPPQCEVRLWEGLDGRGSSWSCQHGIARWESNCGCGRNGSSWNQEWRAPLRRALLHLRDSVREITRRELGGLVYDESDAVNDYISIILNPDPENRAAFIARHAQKVLTAAEQIKLWSLLEARRYAMLMFTSCGWFFDELSGIEPVQNLRYALRTAELCAPWADNDLLARLNSDLAAAQSNIPEQGSGSDILQRQIQSSRYDARIIAAVHVLSRLLETEEPHYNTRIEFLQENRSRRGGAQLLSGRAAAADLWTTTTQEMFFLGAVFADGRAAVFFPETAEELKNLSGLGDKTLAEQAGLQTAAGKAVDLPMLPYADRMRFCHLLLGEEYTAARDKLQTLYAEVMPLLKKIAAARLPMPHFLRDAGENALRKRLGLIVQDIVGQNRVLPEHLRRVDELRAEAAQINLALPTEEAAYSISVLIEDKIADLLGDLRQTAAEELLALVRFSRTLSIPMEKMDRLRDRFWRVLHMSAHSLPDKGKMRDTLQKLSEEFGFVWETVDGLLSRMLT